LTHAAAADTQCAAEQQQQQQQQQQQRVKHGSNDIITSMSAEAPAQPALWHVSYGRCAVLCAVD
jgi:transcription initiation factor TFIID subunit TAF12